MICCRANGTNCTHNTRFQITSSGNVIFHSPCQQICSHFFRVCLFTIFFLFIYIISFMSHVSSTSSLMFIFHIFHSFFPQIYSFIHNNNFWFFVCVDFFTGAIAILHSCSCEKRLIEYAVSVCIHFLPIFFTHRTCVTWLGHSK